MALRRKRLIIILLAVAFALAALPGCGRHVCNGHGGLSHEVKGVAICNDGTRHGAFSGIF